jgi:uncharacterized membrane protein YhaH (DUF805 family)
MEYYLEALRKYAQFTGRARRKEYWMFFLFNLFFMAASMVIGFALEVPLLYPLYVFALFIPSLALGVRRLHDIGKSGWMMLFSLIPLIGSIILIVFMATEGDSHDNEYGRNPKVY